MHQIDENCSINAHMKYHTVFKKMDLRFGFKKLQIVKGTLI